MIIAWYLSIVDCKTVTRVEMIPLSKTSHVVLACREDHPFYYGKLWVQIETYLSQKEKLAGNTYIGNSIYLILDYEDGKVLYRKEETDDKD